MACSIQGGLCGTHARRRGEGILSRGNGMIKSMEVGFCVQEARRNPLRIKFKLPTITTRPYVIWLLPKSHSYLSSCSLCSSHAGFLLFFEQAKLFTASLPFQISMFSLPRIPFSRIHMVDYFSLLGSFSSSITSPGGSHL